MEKTVLEMRNALDEKSEITNQRSEGTFTEGMSVRVKAARPGRHTLKNCPDLDQVFRSRIWVVGLGSLHCSHEWWGAL